MTKIITSKTYSVNRLISFKCPFCKMEVVKHKNPKGAKFHLLFWTPLSTKCSVPNCEVNHKC